MEPVWATKTQQEREDEEAERLVRPAPKKKPPRRDRRRERTDANQDPDTQGDPDMKGDPDMSLNYKDVGAGEIPPQFQKKKDDGTGDDKGGEKKPPPFQKKDDGEDKEGKDEESESEEEEEPSEGEEAGIRPPCRREATAEERFAAMAVLLDTVPDGMQGTVEGLDLHPDDMHDLVLAYKAAQTKNPTVFVDRASQWFETDPDRVTPPLSWRVEGKAVPFETLETADQEEAYRKHQMQVVGMSLAAQHQLTQRLMVPGLRDQPRIPPAFAGKLAMVMLRSPTGKKLRDLQVEAAQDESKKEKLAKQTAELSQTAELTFYDTITSGEYVRVHRNVARSLLRCVDRNDTASRMAKAWLMANDYHTAKQKFLSRTLDKTDEAISEHDSPQKILDGLNRAAAWFKARAAVYDVPVHEGARLFQNRVLERLRALAPDKYGPVKAALGKLEAKNYREAFTAWKQEHVAWEKRREAWEKETAKHGPAAQYRVEAFTEPEPQEPPKPIYQAASIGPEKAKALATAILKDLEVRLTASEPPEPEAKEDEPKGQKRISTCKGAEAMDHNSAKASRVGVYHGVDPLKNAPRTAPGWSQPHQRDMGEADYQRILSAAQDWLQQPVLARPMKGVIRDQQLRAALDLGLKSSGYDRHVSVQLYDKLLARLAGRPEPGLVETFTASNRTSPCAPTPPKKVNTMSASHEIRKMAARVVASDPGLSFDLQELADRVALEEKTVATPEPKVASTDDKFAKLKSLCIRTAHSDADAKRALLPILQALKDLG